MFNGTNSSNGTLLPPLALTLGGSLTFAFYIQPFSVGASAVALNRGAPAPSLPLSNCDLDAISDFVGTASGASPNNRAPDVNKTLWSCTLEHALPTYNPNATVPCPNCPQVIFPSFVRSIFKWYKLMCASNLCGIHERWYVIYILS